MQDFLDRMDAPKIDSVTGRGSFNAFMASYPKDLVWSKHHCDTLAAMLPSFCAAARDSEVAVWKFFQWAYDFFMHVHMVDIPKLLTRGRWDHLDPSESVRLYRQLTFYASMFNILSISSISYTVSQSVQDYFKKCMRELSPQDLFLKVKRFPLAFPLPEWNEDSAIFNLTYTNPFLIQNLESSLPHTLDDPVVGPPTQDQDVHPGPSDACPQSPRPGLPSQHCVYDMSLRLSDETHGDPCRSYLLDDAPDCHLHLHPEAPLHLCPTSKLLRELDTRIHSNASTTPWPSHQFSLTKISSPPGSAVTHPPAAIGHPVTDLPSAEHPIIPPLPTSTRLARKRPRTIPDHDDRSMMHDDSQVPHLLRQ